MRMRVCVCAFVCVYVCVCVRGREGARVSERGSGQHECQDQQHDLTELVILLQIPGRDKSY
jgi:hypothetical protein